jgi:hypothetical protein
VIRVVVDGREFPFPEPPFTYREDGLFRRLTGGGMADMNERSAYDPAVVLAFGVIAARRAGVMVDEDALLDKPIGTVQAVGDEDAAEGDAGPPAEGAGNGAAPSTPATAEIPNAGPAAGGIPG